MRLASLPESPGGRRGWLAAALLLATVAAVYVPLAGRGFTSEDFLLIRVLRQRPPWLDGSALFAGPWLGIDVVRFYRPLSLLLLAVEANLFGGHPWPYGLLHLAVHLLNVLLVYRLALRLFAPVGGEAEATAVGGGAGGSHRWAAFATAALFALYPLHPNAVSWISSYATLFAATPLLAALLAWERWRAGAPAAGDPTLARRRRGAYAAALLTFVAGLLCYEAAVVLPVVLLLRELLVPGAPPARRRWRATLPFFAVAGLYLLARGLLLGAVVGGYGSFAERLTGGGLGRLARDAVVSLFRLFHPPFHRPSQAWAPWTVLLLVLTLPLLHRLARGTVPAPARRELGRWLFAWGWTLTFLAPFAFQPFVPANGRFAYLASVGAALALAQLGRLAVEACRSRPGPGRWGAAAGWLVAAFVVLVAAGWAVRLVTLARAMERAGETAAAVAGALSAVAAEAPAGALFVAGHPRFVLSADGVPLAQVLRYGLADAVEPPFAAPGAAARGVRVYPLPEGPVDGALAALAAAAPALRDAPVVSWDAARGRFVPLAGPRAGAAVARLAVSVRGGGRRIAYRPVAGAAAYRLVVLTRGNPAVVPLAPPPPGGGRGSAALPEDFIGSMRHLYTGPVLGWVEARAADGRLVAVSPAAALPRVADPGRR